MRLVKAGRNAVAIAVIGASVVGVLDTQKAITAMRDLGASYPDVYMVKDQAKKNSDIALARSCPDSDGQKETDLSARQCLLKAGSQIKTYIGYLTIADQYSKYLGHHPGDKDVINTEGLAYARAKTDLKDHQGIISKTGEMNDAWSSSHLLSRYPAPVQYAEDDYAKTVETLSDVHKAVISKGV